MDHFTINPLQGKHAISEDCMSPTFLPSQSFLKFRAGTVVDVYGVLLMLVLKSLQIAAILYCL